MPYPILRRRLACRKLATMIFVLTTALQPRGSTGTPMYVSPNGLRGSEFMPRVRQLTAVSAIGALGKKIFFDASLSGSGRMSCASCHSPAHAYGPPNGLAVQLGGPGTGPPRRARSAVVALRSESHSCLEQEIRRKSRGTARLREKNRRTAASVGMAASTRCTSRQPFRCWRPMRWPMPAPRTVAAKLQHASYAKTFARLFGAQIFDDPRQGLCTGAARY